MTNNNNIETYRVVGRYMTGSAVSAYHLVSLTGKQIRVNKDFLLVMTSRGQVGNTRVQANGSEMILRGKGINLNTLPIFDEKTGKFRDNEASREVANTLVSAKKDSGINTMGQLKIIKRILYKTACLGYIVTDYSGTERRLSREKVIELAIQKLISNAIVQKYKATEDNRPRLILRGVGCDLSALPYLVVDETGSLIDPTVNRGEINLRAAKMRRGGLVHDKVSKSNIAFEAGDYLVCGIDCTVKTIKSNLFKELINSKVSSKTAICDGYFDNLSRYTIEIFGTDERPLTAENVSKWAVVRENRV